MSATNSIPSSTASQSTVTLRPGDLSRIDDLETNERGFAKVYNEKLDLGTGSLPPVAPGSEGPDGGAAAWLVVLGAWCISFCSFGWINSKSTVYGLFC